MSRKLFNLPLGASPHPLAFKRDPLAAAMIGSALVGAASNWISGSSSNSANASMNRETREWQSKENAMNRNWQEEMFNKQNVYNTPSAQRARLEEAGYNPFMDASMGVGQGSNAGSAGSPSMVGSPNAIPNQPVNVGGPLATVGAGLAQLHSVNAQSANQDAQRYLNFAKAIPDLLKVYSNKQVAEMGQMMLGSSPSYFKYYERQMNADILRIEAESELAQLENQIRHDYGNEHAKRSLDLLQSNIDDITSQINWRDSDLDRIASELLVNAAKVANLNADTATLNALRPYVAKVLEYEADMALYDRDEARSDYFFNSGVRGYKESKEGQDVHTNAWSKFNEDINERTKKARVLADILRGNSGWSPDASYSRSSDRSSSLVRRSKSSQFVMSKQ